MGETLEIQNSSVAIRWHAELQRREEAREDFCQEHSAIFGPLLHIAETGTFNTDAEFELYQDELVAGIEDAVMNMLGEGFTPVGEGLTLQRSDIVDIISYVVNEPLAEEAAHKALTGLRNSGRVDWDPQNDTLQIPYEALLEQNYMH